MRRLVLLLVAVASLAIGVSLASSATVKKACSKGGTGKWEVVLGANKTLKAAKSMVQRADAKGLKAATAHDTCTHRWNADVAASTKAKAEAILAKAKKDGFTKATIQKG